MSNPVFDRIDKGVRSGGYAGFGTPRAPQQPQQGYGPQYGRYSDAQQGYGRPQYGQYAPQDSPQHLDDLYNRPPAGPTQMGRVTVDDVVMKAMTLFGIMLVVAAGTWFVLPLPLTGVAMLAGIALTLVLGLVIAFKKTVSVPLIVAYAAFEGLLVGGVSRMYASAFEGVVTTAIIATLCVFAAMFGGWKTGVIKVTSKTRRIFGMAILGYMLFAVVNLVVALFGGNDGWGMFGFGSGMSILVSVFAVGLASYSLAMDFDSIDRAVAAQLPEKYSWLLAHGLLVTVVWLYLELLRLIAQFTGRD